MISFYQLEKRINDLSHEIVPQDIHFTAVHAARIDALKWCRLEGEVKSEKDILNRIQRHNEELLAFTDTNDLMCKQIKVKIEELYNVLDK